MRNHAIYRAQPSLWGRPWSWGHCWAWTLCICGALLSGRSCRAPSARWVSGVRPADPCSNSTRLPPSISPGPPTSLWLSQRRRSLHPVERNTQSEEGKYLNKNIHHFLNCPLLCVWQTNVNKVSKSLKISDNLTLWYPKICNGIYF